MANPKPTMRAVAIDHFGGIEVLRLQHIPLPDPGPDEVRIRVQSAGVGEWDPFEREGGYAELIGVTPHFPYVLGSEGAGVVESTGADVVELREGDRVYAPAFLNPKGGFYAEYAVVPTKMVARVPEHLTIEQAAAISGVGLTALRGLEDVLAVARSETLLVFGANGGVGHMAVQLAKLAGARVLAIASGDDGVALTRRLGADAAVNGRDDDVEASCRAFAPLGFDAALVTAGGDAANRALTTMRKGGRVAYPNGVQPDPVVSEGVRLDAYNGEPDEEIVRRLHQRLLAGRIEAHIDRVFSLEEAGEAHRALTEHHCGKLVLRVAEE